MPRFSAPFTRRKSAALIDEFQHPQPTTPPEQHSFRVLERSHPQNGKSFDGGVRMSRPPQIASVPRHVQDDIEADDNIFAGLNPNRGSGASNTTKATSADNSSRHSNASTAPSSADIPHHATEDKRGSLKRPPTEPSRPPTKSSTSSFLDRAGRTFSFGMQKRNMPPLPKHEQEPVPVIQHEDYDGRTRAMTASTASTATPPKLNSSSTLDLGGDFGSMFNTFDKRASTQTLKNDSQRPIQPPPLNIEKTTAAKPSPTSETSQTSNDDLLGVANIPSAYGRPPPVPKHQPSFEYRTSRSPTDTFEDEDAKLLADSVAVNRFLSSGGPDNSRSGRYRRDEDDDEFDTTPKRPFISSQFAQEDNMFAGTTAATSRYVPRNHTNTRPASPPRTKVMTPAEFERFKQEKEREGLERMANRMKDDDDDEDEIDYDDDEDEEDKAREQVKQRRRQAASMLAYRQQMMKTTGNTEPSPPPPASMRPAFPTTNSAPQLGQLKTPSPDPARREPVQDDDEDEDVPLAILQAHGFPHKNRSASRLSIVGSTSNPNLRASAMLQPGRPASVVGEPSNHSQNRNQRHSALPAFARGLPQDPFVGAGLSRPAARESLGMAIGQHHLQPPQQQQPIHPGGLVGVIASEERSRAMRRGSPNLDTQRASIQPGVDPINGIPAHMMYNGGGHFGMAGGIQPGQQQQMPQQQQQLSTGEQAQLQMTQNMQQFMQMQMQFMQMMAANQNGGNMPQMQMPMPQQGQQQFHPGQMPNAQSMGHLGSGQSMLSDNSRPQRLNNGMRTMSMIQPSSASFMQPNGFGGPGAGYTPSIAPSERSNIGLPGRYRPVSHAPGSFLDAPSPKMHQRASTMSGALSIASGNDSFMDKSKIRASIRSVESPKAVDDDDDEEGWAAMRAKRDKKKSMWKWKKEEYY